MLRNKSPLLGHVPVLNARFTFSPARDRVAVKKWLLFHHNNNANLAGNWLILQKIILYVKLLIAHSHWIVKNNETEMPWSLKICPM